jgi:hypothetical protein
MYEFRKSGRLRNEGRFRVQGSGFRKNTPPFTTPAPIPAFNLPFVP